VVSTTPNLPVKAGLVFLEMGPTLQGWAFPLPLTIKDGSLKLYSSPDSVLQSKRSYKLENKWRHIAVSMPRPNCKVSEVVISIDGTPIQTNIFGKNKNIFFISSGKVSIGGFGHSNDNFESIYPHMYTYKGAVDDFYMWSRPIEAEDFLAMGISKTTPMPTPVPTPQSTPQPTTEPTPSPSESPSESPFMSLSESSSESPSEVPSQSPSESPSTSDSQSAFPSNEPIEGQTDTPVSFRPTPSPSESPLKSPSMSLSESRSQYPSEIPSQSPSESPSTSDSQSAFPSNEPIEG